MVQLSPKFLRLVLVIMAGEGVFMLPFMIPRIFRPLILEGWGLTNTQVGVAYSIYGVVAMVSYFLGGPFADKYHPRSLIAGSLVLTAIGGAVLIAFPSLPVFYAVYGLFGFSTIFFLWAAMIKVTHVVGGETSRATAMGILDSGRGLTAALMSSLLVFVIGYFFPDFTKADDRLGALKIIYTLVIAANFLIAFAVWQGLKAIDFEDSDKLNWSLEKAKYLFKNFKVWLMGLIVLSAYCGFKSIDNYSIYMVSVLGRDIQEASILTSLIFWLRPVAALGAGFLADYFHSRRSGGRFWCLSTILFLAAALQLSLAANGFGGFTLIYFTILASAAFAYAMRAIYFSVFGDLKIEGYLIGTTVGIVSFVGFLPDVFFGYITGRMIDANPGALGFEQTFVFTAICLLVGAVASLWLYRRA